MGPSLGLPPPPPFFLYIKKRVGLLAFQANYPFIKGSRPPPGGDRQPHPFFFYIKKREGGLPATHLLFLKAHTCRGCSASRGWAPQERESSPLLPRISEEFALSPG